MGIEMYLRAYLLSLICCCLVCSQISCSRSKGKVVKDKVPLSHVTGTVLINSEPAQNVIIDCVPLSPIAETRPQFGTLFRAVTALDGTFSLSTYSRGDGVPYGQYAVLFKRLEQRPSGEKDLLGGQYSDVLKPLMKIKVEEGTDLDLGEITLKQPANAGK
jgi:hypothetical protein